MTENENTLDLRPRRSTRTSQIKREKGFDTVHFEDSAQQEASSYEPDKSIIKRVSKAHKEASRESRISFGTSFLMVATALFFDSAQGVFNIIGLIPVIGTVVGGTLSFMIGFFAWLTFYTWFKMHGISFMRPQRILALWGAGLIELVPYLNALPAWTFAVLFLIATTKIEDKTGINPTKLANPVHGGNVSNNP
ncbi:MAG: hypothetical protein A2741_01000 [Candidatus Zambryskibacteria bacterium RIFCSPHIGHO2_01_FULL_43_27]|uniref:Uncharacterized protein n=1 Tax=Candidatus Zambryskibacteria bacterium RIFCSPLOWO2_01_FULL_43_17 TaxID=1802760 RepID=A0A1G2U6G5_9BACT|nr:MAG: hypothetical protein A2741_01000 [Candidatus Zambryskibacteria bacterium RIFCSPHIGHO2_01_FULL_43_27]OHB00080.1 MAG: hypothetical protein A3E93_01995 [Candidatus Zambryskibacteria bacterium RIFCSPHIGHO2_12_FULL_43_12b]OHB04610.1 MAG: hypothetical protein A2920_01580 [Candidatus Zambryskibacteria bacterium RIFCSPLOWO2_01_FULL_43_17]